MITNILIIVFVLLFSWASALAGLGLAASMQSKKDLLGFIPAYLERLGKVNTKLYKFLTCPYCLAGQVALISGLAILYIPAARWAFGVMNIKDGAIAVMVVVLASFMAIGIAEKLSK
jgi:hypothetical protein